MNIKKKEKNMAKKKIKKEELKEVTGGAACAALIRGTCIKPVKPK